MTASPIDLSREQILSYRRRVGALNDRLPPGSDSLRQAAWAGLQDSMPRAALLAIHARINGTQPIALDDPSLIQVWGPRFSAYVVSAEDRAVFTLGRMPNKGSRRQMAEELATRIDHLLAGAEMTYGEAGRALGEDPNKLRYATLTGRVLIRWDGARQPTIRTLPPPEIEPSQARMELARRYLHVFGPASPRAFAGWAGIKPPVAMATFDAIRECLRPVMTPIGEASILAEDEAIFRAEPEPASPARLLPSGDPYFLLWGEDRELLVPIAGQRDALWTSRVWPGAVLVRGEVVGTWRRTQEKVKVQPWRTLSAAEHEVIEAEAVSLPLPGAADQISVLWGD